MNKSNNEDMPFEVFKHFGQIYLASDSKSKQSVVFKEHAQFPLLIDVLSRKHAHHVCMTQTYSLNVQKLFIEAFSIYISKQSVPYHLYEADILFLDQLNYASCNHTQLAKNLGKFYECLKERDKLLIIILPTNQYFNFDPNSKLTSALAPFTEHPEVRLIIFSQSDVQHAFLQMFTHITLNELSAPDFDAIFEQEREALEKFHQVIIPKEMAHQIIFLTKRYYINRSGMGNANSVRQLNF